MLELAHPPLESRGILRDHGKPGLVTLGLDQRKEFRGVREARAELVELRDRRVQAGALAAECLGLFRRVPDGRVAELVVQLLEALPLRVVFKGTPSAPSGAP
jgi:hypothetical protein